MQCIRMERETFFRSYTLYQKKEVINMADQYTKRYRYKGVRTTKDADGKEIPENISQDAKNAKLDIDIDNIIDCANKFKNDALNLIPAIENKYKELASSYGTCMLVDDGSGAVTAETLILETANSTSASDYNSKPISNLVNGPNGINKYCEHIIDNSIKGFNKKQEEYNTAAENYVTSKADAGTVQEEEIN